MDTDELTTDEIKVIYSVLKTELVLCPQDKYVEMLCLTKKIKAKLHTQTLEERKKCL